MRKIPPPLFRRFSSLHTTCLLIFALAAAACSKDTTGFIQLDISGLPAGVAASVAVQGPAGYQAQLVATQQLRGLVVGAYSVTAQSVSSDGVTYTAAVTGSPAQVQADTQLTVSVVYSGAATTTGSLAITVSGLPSDASADAMVTGPASYSHSITSTQTLSNLAVGTYTINAQSIISGGSTYTAAVAGSPATVTANQTATAAIVYTVVSPTEGALAVTISHVPTGSEGNVTITGPGSFSQSITATQTLTGLVPGTYTITAQSISASGVAYTATVTGSPAMVVAGQSASATVVYAEVAPTEGGLTVSISGVPSGSAGSVTVSGPASFSQAITATQTLGNLAPGTYTITAQSISVSGATYTAAVTGSPATVVAGQTAAASVVYTVVSADVGSLTVSVSGVPDGAAGNVTVSGPASFSQSISATQTLSNLTPGAYTIDAQSISAGGFAYTAAVTGSPATVVSGQTASASVVYTATTGNLTLNMSGLPSGLNGSYDVSCVPLSYSAHYSSSQALTGLSAGSYTISTASVTASDQTRYSATVTSSPAVVSLGQTTTVSIVYAPFTGSLTITTTSGYPYYIQVAGPNSYSTNVASTPYKINGLLAGAYTVTATTYQDSGSVSWTAVITGSPATVVAGQNVDVTVAYAPPAPTITSITPAIGVDGKGGASIGINGTNFVPGQTQVSIDGTLITTTINYDSDAQIYVTAPAHAVGVVDVVVTTPGGSSAISSADQLPYYHFDYYPTPTTTARTGGMTAGPDGNVWFTERALNTVGKMTPAGVVTEYPLPGANGDPVDIAAGADGDLWVTDYFTSQIVQVTPSGVVTDFPLASLDGCKTFGIAPGPNSTIWFTEIQCSTGSSNKVGKITTDSSHTITEYELSTTNFPLTFGMGTGPDGNPWWADYDSSQIGTISATDVVSTYAAGGNFSPCFPTTGPDGNLWIAGSNNGYASIVGVMTPTGVYTTHPTSGGTSVSSHIIADSKGLWYAASGLGYIDAASFASVLYPAAGSLSGVTVGPDGAIYFLSQDYDNNNHAAIGRFTR